MKLFQYLFIVLAVLTIFACSKDVVDTSGNIVGIVSDARTGEPLSDVSVTVNPIGKSIKTGKDGRYEFVSIEQGNYTVQAQKVNYQTDQKNVTVIPAESQQLDFLLKPSSPNLVVSQNTIDFGNDATTLSLEIANNGNAVLEWNISENISWFSCLPTRGSVHVGEKAAVVLNVDREGLKKGNYSQTFSISSNGGSCDVRVNMSVEGSTVNVTPEQLDFGSTTTVVSLMMKNTGAGTAYYTLATSNAWIKLAKLSGSIAAGASEQITVSVDRNGLSEGDYTGNIVVTVDGNKFDIPVKMNIPTKAKPTVYLSGVTDVTYSDAVFNAAIVSVGSANVTRHGFVWDTEENPTIENAEFCNFADCDKAKEYSHKALNLKQSTTYYVRAYAENIEGISYSLQEKFVTPGVPALAEVTTGEVSNITSSQAEVSGVLTSLGNLESVIQYGHVWSTKSNPTVNDNKSEKGETWSTGSFVSTMTGLKPNVIYHVRAYAVNKKGTAYGEDVTFTTDYAVVSLITGEASDITSKSAKVTGKITDKGGHRIVERGVCWADTSMPTLADKSTVASTTNDEFVATLTDLSAVSVYYARAYVKTERGDVYYGNSISFTTPVKEVDVNVGDYEDEEFWQK